MEVSGGGGKGGGGDDGGGGADGNYSINAVMAVMLL